MTKEFPKRLLRIYECVYSSPRVVLIYRIIDRVAVALSALIFAVSVYFAFCRGLTEGVKLLLLAAIPFVLVSTVRALIKAPRPYELVDFCRFSQKPPHYKKGSSFPSRHVFSAFLIAVLAFEYSWQLGVLALDLSLTLALLRVVLGIHFPKDVICGAIIGVASGVVGILIL